MLKVTKLRRSRIEANAPKIKRYLLLKGFSHMDIQRYIDFMQKANPLTMFRSFY